MEAYCCTPAGTSGSAVRAAPHPNAKVRMLLPLPARRERALPSWTTEWEFYGKIAVGNALTVARRSEQAASGRALTTLVAPLIFLFVRLHRHGIDAGEPAVEIDVGAAPRAEGTVGLDGTLAADRTGPGRVWIAHAPDMGREQKRRHPARCRPAAGVPHSVAFSQPK